MRHSREEPREELYISCNQLFSFWNEILRCETHLCFWKIIWILLASPLQQLPEAHNTSSPEGETGSLITHLKISQPVILGEVWKALWSPPNVTPQKAVLPPSQSYSPWGRMSGNRQIHATFFTVGLEVGCSRVMARAGFQQEKRGGWRDASEPCNLSLSSRNDKGMISEHRDTKWAQSLLHFK